MIRKAPNGRYYCDGRGCGTPLQWAAPDPEDAIASGEVYCLDCWSSMWTGKDNPLRVSVAGNLWP